MNGSSLTSSILNFSFAFSDRANSLLRLNLIRGTMLSQTMTSSLDSIKKSKSSYLLGGRNFAESVAIKLVPSPSLLSTRKLPPILSTINLQILRPRPLPSGFLSLFSSRVLKSVNRQFNFSYEIPQP